MIIPLVSGEACTGLRNNLGSLPSPPCHESQQLHREFGVCQEAGWVLTHSLGNLPIS